MTTSDPGKWAERQARIWLEAQSTFDADFVYHRYPDAKAARGALAAQPADYLVSSDGRIFHLEVKETKQVHRLPKAKIRQYGMLLKWHWGNIAPIVLIYQSETKLWTYLSAVQLFQFADCPPSFDLTLRPKFFSCDNALKEIFA